MGTSSCIVDCWPIGKPYAPAICCGRNNKRDSKRTMIIQKLPPEFVLNHIPLSWREALWGYENQLIDWTVLKELAFRRANSRENENSTELELASLPASESSIAGGYACELANNEVAIPDKNISRKWLYVVLQWVFDHRDQISDPLSIVEDIYVDFDYPMEVMPFVRSLPDLTGYDPLQHTEAENEEYLYKRWSEYLSKAKREFSDNDLGNQ